MRPGGFDLRTRLPAVVAGQLDEIKFQVGIAPPLAPGIDQHREKMSVLPGLGCAGFALIPQNSADSVRDQRRDHAVEQISRRMPLPRHIPAPRETLLHRQAVFELMDRLHEAVVDRFGNRIFDQLGTRHPTLDGRPAEISADDADRHAQTLFQFLRECVGDRRPARHAFRVRLLPPSSGRKHRLLRRPLEWDEQADIRIANHRHIALPHFHLHVGLSRSEPHLAHSHVAERRGILSRNDPHHQPGVGRERPEQYLPVACAVGPRLVTFSRESQPDRRAGGGPAPDRNAASALQHHPVAENHRQPQVPRQVLGHGTIQAVIRERHRIARRIEPGNAQAESRHMVFDSDFEQHRSVGVVGNDDLPRPPVLPVDDRSPDDGKIILPLRLQNGKMSLLPHAEITVLPAKRLESRITRRGSDPQ